MTNEDITKELTRMRKNFDTNSVYGSYCIDCLDAAIEALKEQPKNSQNAMSKQPDSETLGIKTGETCADVISRRDAIDAVEFGITYVKVINKETGEVIELFKKSNEELQKAVDRIEALPSAKPKQRWIPCSERLPEPRIDVWCNSDMGQMVGYYEENVETWYGRDYLELMVTAWMPLPEPYKGES